ncbi:MAG: DUF2092 domain-containing protein [Deltaproteobacteria bacterium]|nr:DUF2092 domain-containing protein [Deltaproteobacteria bacterium]MBW2414933.1 DUF2092 domain-containing protein [Deltaproteobacteria bacterium]
MNTLIPAARAALASAFLVCGLGALPAAAQEVNPTTRDVLRRSTDTLKAAKRLSFHAELTFDESPRPGLLVQTAGAVNVDLRRPNGLHVDYRDDHGAKTLWYDGGKLTLLDWSAGVFAKREIPGTVSETLDKMEQKLGLTMPLAELIDPDPGKALLRNALRGTYLGIHDVEGVACHHLAFLQENVDWEIWIEKGAVPVPRKLLIRYKQEPGWPQYVAVLMDWKLDGKQASDTYDAQIPAGAVPVEFIDIKRARK